MPARVILIDSIRNQRLELEQAAQVLRDGGLVVFPTETVFGLGANLFNQDAVKKIFTVKNRPLGLPLALHLSSPKYINRWVKSIPENAQKLIDHFLPGPLMLILEKSADIPELVTAGGNKIGIRVPHHPVCSSLLGLAGVPVVATSANLTGSPSAVTLEQVQRELADKVDMILDSPENPLGIESTVIDLTTPTPRILRSGFIDHEAISKVLGEPVILSTEPSLFKSGADKLNFQEVWLLTGNRGETSILINQIIAKYPQREKTWLLTTETAALEPLPGEVFLLGSGDKVEEIAQNLFTRLAELKMKSGDLLVIEGITDSGLGTAIMERLRKFAGRALNPGDAV